MMVMISCIILEQKSVPCYSELAPPLSAVLLVHMFGCCRCADVGDLYVWRDAIFRPEES